MVYLSILNPNYWFWIFVNSNEWVLRFSPLIRHKAVKGLESLVINYYVINVWALGVGSARTKLAHTFVELQKCIEVYFLSNDLFLSIIQILNFFADPLLCE